MRAYFSLLLVLLSIHSIGWAQTDPTSHLFHVNDIRSWSRPSGLEFTDLKKGSFSVPFEGPYSLQPIQSKQVAFTGITASGGPLVAASSFQSVSYCSFHPGPGLPYQNTPSGNSEDYNQIFSVTGAEIRRHILDAEDGNIDDPLKAIFGWPGNGNSWFEDIHGFPLFQSDYGAAPFVETSGNENGIYEPELGEYPSVKNLPRDIIPDQIDWMIYSPRYTDHTQGGCMPVEIKQTTYGFNCTQLDKTIFQQYEVRNFGEEAITEFKAGIEVATALGCGYDDAVGTSIEHQCVYVYNADNDDADDPCLTKNYGANPPAFAFGPLNHNLNSTIYTLPKSIGPSDPRKTNRLKESYLKFHNSQWLDGTPLTEGGTGYNTNSTDSTKFIFPGDPQTSNGWNMITEDLVSTFWNLLFTTGKERLEVNDPYILDVAFHYARDENLDHLRNAEKAVQEFGAIRDIYLNGNWPCSAELCDCSCIWPGDANANGKVEISDIAQIAMSFGEQGTERMKGLAWFPKNTQDWSSEVMGINSKHADINGDGMVDYSDFKFWNLYEGLVNSCHTPTPDYCEEGPDVYIKMMKEDSALEAQKVYLADIILKNISSLVGVSFDVKFDRRIWNYSTVTTNPWKNPDTDWFFEQGRQPVSESNPFSYVVMNTEKLNRELKQDSDNNMLTINFITNSLPDTYHQSNATIKICNFTVYYEDGVTEKLPTQTLTYRLPDDVVITNTKEEENNVIQIIPNPTVGLIQVTGLGQTSSALLVDLHGKPVMEKIINEGDFMDISALPVGLYFLQIKDGDQLWSKRVIKQ